MAFIGAAAAALIGQWQTHFLRPNEDVAYSTWNYSGAGVDAHYKAVDEVTADDATTYTRVSVGVKDSASNPLTLGFENPDNAVVTGQPVLVKVRHMVNTTVEDDNEVRWDFRLLEGGVERDSWFANQEDDGNWVTTQRTLSAAVRAAINDWDDVRVEVKATWTAGTSFEVDCDVTWEEISLHE
jgi:hypothetical protein